MQTGVRILAADDARIDTLLRGCDLDPAHVERLPRDAAARAAIHGDGADGLILVATELDEDLALLAHRTGARVCLATHGPRVLREAIVRATRDGEERGERRRLEEAMRAGENVRVLVGVSVADVIFHLGVEGERFRFLEINPAFTKATGLATEQVVGKPVDEVIPEPSLGLVLSRYRQAIAERRTVRWIETTEYPAGKKYGEVSVTPVLGRDGRCTSLVGTVNDVTASVQERMLREAEHRVLEMVASGASLADTLTALAGAIEEQVPSALASVLLVSPDGKHLTFGAGPHLSDAYRVAVDGLRIGKPESGSCGLAVSQRRTVVVRDIATDPIMEAQRELARSLGLRACWSSPVLVGNTRVLGTFALYYREPHEPSPAEIEILARATHVAGIAIHRHELDAQMRALSARIEAAREEERTGIAREIHDQLGQGLTVLKMDLAWITRRAQSPEGLSREALVDKVREISELTSETIEQVRRISSELRPGVLDDLGLVAALSWQAQEFEKRTQTPCVVHAQVGDEAPRRDVVTTVFRVFQEALTNVARHAGAMRVDVALEEQDGWLELRVRDDGKGLPTTAVQDPRSLGLLGIRERARSLGGTASFASLEPQGTLVTLRLPTAPVSTHA